MNTDKMKRLYHIALSGLITDMVRYFVRTDGEYRPVEWVANEQAYVEKKKGPISLSILSKAMNNRVTHFSINQLLIYPEELLLDSAEK